MTFYSSMKNGEIYPIFTTNQWISIPRWKNGEIDPTFTTNQRISIPRWKNLFLYTFNFFLQISPNESKSVQIFHSDFLLVFTYNLVFTWWFQWNYMFIQSFEWKLISLNTLSDSLNWIFSYVHPTFESKSAQNIYGVKNIYKVLCENPYNYFSRISFYNFGTNLIPKETPHHVSIK